MDGCAVALPTHVEEATEDFNLPPLECEVRMADQKSDVSNKLLSSLKRSGWVVRVSACGLYASARGIMFRVSAVSVGGFFFCRIQRRSQECELGGGPPLIPFPFPSPLPF